MSNRVGIAISVLLLAWALPAWGAGPGYISTVAGSGRQCSASTAACGDGGPVILASFSSPRGVTLTPDGGYLITDRYDHRIRKVSSVSPLGIITTIAGTGVEGFSGDGGLATAAELDAPQDVALRPDGSLLIADAAEVPTPGFGNERIRLVTGQSAAAVFSLNSETFQTGQHLTYRATLLPGAGQPPVVDVYLGAVQPNGQFASLVSAGPNLITVVIGTAPVPFKTSVQLAQTTVVPLTYTFTGLELAGTYFAYAELVPPGGSPFQPLSLDVTAFAFAP